METAKCPSKRNSFTVEQNVEFIKLIDSGEQQIDVSNKFGVNASTLCKRFTRIVNGYWMSGSEVASRTNTFKSADNDALDSALVAWFKKATSG